MKNFMIVLSLAFVLSMFTGLASAAGLSEPIYPPEPGGSSCWVQVPGDVKWYPCGSEEVFAVNCVRLMEKNMRRIDPFLAFVETGSKFTPEEKEKYEKALALWNQVKHDCWKEFAYERDKHLH